MVFWFFKTRKSIKLGILQFRVMPSFVGIFFRLCETEVCIGVVDGIFTTVYSGVFTHQGNIGPVQVVQKAGYSRVLLK